MDRKLSDEQLDKIAKNLLKDFAPAAETLDEIAESPKIWWNVRNRIEAEKARREKSWFVFLRPQTLAFGALAVLVCFGLAALFLRVDNNLNPPVAEQKGVHNPAEETVKGNEEITDFSPKINSVNPEMPEKRASNPVPEKVTTKNIEPKPKFVAKNRNVENPAKSSANPSKKEVPATLALQETKTDFIALSYAANTDSGQIVRVKVPSSMMVSLGVKTNVEKESELVNAEVVIGDDGLARAIRFIR